MSGAVTGDTGFVQVSAHRLDELTKPDSNVVASMVMWAHGARAERMVGGPSGEWQIDEKDVEHIKAGGFYRDHPMRTTGNPGGRAR